MRLLWTILFLLFAAFMVAIVCLKNAGLAAPFFNFFGHLPYHDKIGHFVLMGILGFLAVGAVAPRLPIHPLKATLRVLATVVVLIAFEELSQGFIPGRTLSLGDFLCSAAGALICGGIAHGLHQRITRTE